MKAGFKVLNVSNGSKINNAILVDNYHRWNEVVNLQITINKLKQKKDRYSVGVWKIKKLISFD